jgi:hypothetical protein
MSEVFMVFHCSSSSLKLGHDRFLPRPSIHNHPTIQPYIIYSVEYGHSNNIIINKQHLRTRKPVMLVEELYSEVNIDSSNIL